MNRWEIVEKKGSEEVAVVYLLRSAREKGVFIECVESLDPPKPPEEKWVMTLSSQKGCPAGCVFCDASYYYGGSLAKEDLAAQLDIMTGRHLDDGRMRSKKIKLHFARMGEPAFNDAILDFLPELSARYGNASFIPTIATVGPAGRGRWFARLREIKDLYFGGGNFQLQFSMNTTDEAHRDRIMPVRKISFAEIAGLGKRWFRKGDRKVTLNYALFKESPFDAGSIAALFDPGLFLVKITPMNPTTRAESLGMESDMDFAGGVSQRVKDAKARLESGGFDVILSAGSIEEIMTGSNCGQLAFARRIMEKEGSSGGIMNHGGADG